MGGAEVISGNNSVEVQVLLSRHITGDGGNRRHSPIGKSLDNK
jgi:hypothetical protein